MTPHVLRHTYAMRLLTVGVDTSVIALWLGHEGVETTQIYLHADLAIRNGRSLARPRPARRQVAIGLRTRCSPSWRACDYPDFNSQRPLCSKGWRTLLGIIRCSA